MLKSSLISEREILFLSPLIFLKPPSRKVSYLHIFSPTSYLPLNISLSLGEPPGVVHVFLCNYVSVWVQEYYMFWKK